MQTCSPFNTSRAEDIDTKRRNGNALIDTVRRRYSMCAIGMELWSAVLATRCWSANYIANKRTNYSYY